MSRYFRITSEHRLAATQVIYPGVSSGKNVCCLQRTRSTDAWGYSYFAVAWFSENAMEWRSDIV